MSFSLFCHEAAQTLISLHSYCKFTTVKIPPSPPQIKNRAVRESDYSPAKALSEEKDKCLRTGEKEK